MQKLCSTCAYRATCNKKYSAVVANGEVRCIDYAADFELLKKEKEEEKKRDEEGEETTDKNA